MMRLFFTVLILISSGCANKVASPNGTLSARRNPASLYAVLGDVHLVFKRDFFENTNKVPALECLVFSNGRVLSLRNGSVDSYMVSTQSRDMVRSARMNLQNSLRKDNANAGGGQGGRFAKLVYYFQPEKNQSSKKEIFSMWLNYEHGPALLDGKEGDDFLKGIKGIDKLCSLTS